MEKKLIKIFNDQPSSYLQAEGERGPALLWPCQSPKAQGTQEPSLVTDLIVPSVLF